MNVTTDAVEPPYATTIAEPSGSHDYLFVVGFFFTVLLLLVITYAAYTCKSSRSPPPTYDDLYDQDIVRLSRGLVDDVIETFPTFVYSDVTMPDQSATAKTGDSGGCSICLADYKPPDVLRLLPKCGHLFHVSCIDTWLKYHPTCPVCRNSPLAGMVNV